ncbi:MAG: type I-C CRISPR-associated protein Cas8c/Csd1 [Sulfuriferula sp.]
MILQALKEYYVRKAADPNSLLPPEGWISKGIDYVIVLEKDGQVVRVECLQTNDGRNSRPKIEFVPYIGEQAVKHTNSGKDANLLWDNSAFVFGLGKSGDVKIASFIEAIVKNLPSEDQGIKAVCSFIRCGIADPAFFEPILTHPSYGKELISGFPIVTFQLAGDDVSYVFYRPTVKSYYEQGTPGGQSTVNRICLITGNPNAPIQIKHPSIKNLYGQQKIGPLISFNERAFESYGKEKKQGENAPVSKQAVAAYSKALAHLLQSKQKLHVGDASTVFWADAPDELETGFLDLFGEPRKDDPDCNVKAVESLYRSVETGSFATNSDTTRFFVLGLAPNAARISVRFWQTGTVAEFAGRIRQHFDDLKIGLAPFDLPYLSLFRLLVSTARLGESKNIPPNLAGEFMRAILAGLPYPQTLLQAAIRQIRAEQAKKNDKTSKSLPNVTYARVALIKACLNRASRFRNQKEDITVSLDTTNSNPAYRLGRLFAVFEKIQETANPGLNATIRDRFYGAASSSPVTVFPTLLKLKNHHLAKLSAGQKVYYEKMIGEIVSELREFPAQLPLPEQGRFAIGYYHQQRDLYTKK